MLHVYPLTDTDVTAFGKMFENYYKELGCDDDAEHLCNEYIIPDLKAGLLSIDLLEADGLFAGFVIYQKDDIDNEWNYKEGWGDVREIYVIPSLRRQGLGKFLLYTAEMKLRESGIEKCYCLPAEGAEGFFVACGYIKGSAYSSELGCYEYEKTNLDNKCHK